MSPNAFEARLVDRFIDRLVTACLYGAVSPESVRESLRIFVAPDSVEGAVVSVCCVALGADLVYTWDGTEDDAEAIIDAAAVHLAARAKPD